jgi:RNA polymerase sigma-70 factor (ECF subfamily)
VSTPTPTIDYLLAAARAGSRDALGDVLDGCREYLLHVATQELAPGVRSKVGASDLVQETLLEAHRDFAQFRGRTESELLGWLREILRHNLANAARRYLVTAKRRADREVSLTDHFPGEGATGAASPAPSPAAAAAAEEERAAVMRALARLPDGQRHVIQLRNFDGLPFDAIAARMGRTPEAARQLWARAVCRLQQELKDSP